MGAIQSGLAEIDAARLYYELAGEGQPLVMLHAGVADSRQWNNEFTHFSGRYRVLRYDLRGYGKSEPVAGEFSHLQDLNALLDYLGIEGPLVMMGCSMGGGLAMDFTLAQPSRVKALIMVGSGPSGLELDVPMPDQFAEVEKAFQAKELDRLAELETQVWFDGYQQPSNPANRTMRALAYAMNRHALDLEVKGLGKRLPDSQTPASGRLEELDLPVLVIVGEHDIPYIQAAADYMLEHIPSARKVTLHQAAHLANMNQPEAFQKAVTAFLDELDR